MSVALSLSLSLCLPSIVSLCVVPMGPEFIKAHPSGPRQSRRCCWMAGGVGRCLGPIEGVLVQLVRVCLFFVYSRLTLGTWDASFFEFKG